MMKYVVKFFMISLLCTLFSTTLFCMEAAATTETSLVASIEKIFESTSIVIEPTVAEQQEVVVLREQTKSKVKSSSIKSCCCNNCCCMSAVAFVFKHMRCLCKCFTCMTCCCSNKCIDCLCRE